jgi:hypothetical protein
MRNRVRGLPRARALHLREMIPEGPSNVTTTTVAPRSLSPARPRFMLEMVADDCLGELNTLVC